MKLSIFFFFFDVELWEPDWPIWLTFTSSFFFYPVFVFLNLAVHTLCSLASYTPALVTIFFFFFLGPVVQPQQCLCVVCLWVVCCVFVCYKCFCFWWVSGCVCVLGWACWWVCLCVVCSHITQVSIQKNNLKKFWKSYNINNIGFFFFFKGHHHPTFID